MRKNVLAASLLVPQNQESRRSIQISIAKIGFQVSELFDDELLKEKVVRVAEQKNVLL